MNGKTQSILSYLGILWLVAFFAGKDTRDDLSKFHLKQGLGLLILGIIFNIIVTIITFISPSIAMLLSYFGLVFLIFMIIGIIHAVNEVKKPLPLVGPMFEKQFDFLNQ